MCRYPLVVDLPPYIVEVKVYEPGDMDPELGMNHFDRTVWDKWAHAEQILDDVYLTRDSMITEEYTRAVDD